MFKAINDILSKYPTEMRIIIARGFYGAFVGIVLSFLALLDVLTSIAIILVNQSLAPFFTWIMLFLFYIPSIYIADKLGAVKKFDRYLRGFSVYFALAVLTHILITSI